MSSTDLAKERTENLHELVTYWASRFADRPVAIWPSGQESSNSRTKRIHPSQFCCVPRSRWMRGRCLIATASTFPRVLPSERLPVASSRRYASVILTATSRWLSSRKCQPGRRRSRPKLDR